MSPDSLTFAHWTAAARNVERDGAKVSLLDEFHVLSALDDLSGDFVTKNHVSTWQRSTATHHMLVGTANVGADNLQNNSVLTLALLALRYHRAGRAVKLQLWEWNVLYLNMVGSLRAWSDKQVEIKKPNDS